MLDNSFYVMKYCKVNSRGKDLSERSKYLNDLPHYRRFSWCKIRFLYYLECTPTMFSLAKATFLRSTVRVWRAFEPPKFCLVVLTRSSCWTRGFNWKKPPIKIIYSLFSKSSGSYHLSTLVFFLFCNALSDTSSLYILSSRSSSSMLHSMNRWKEHWSNLL